MPLFSCSMSYFSSMATKMFLLRHPKWGLECLSFCLRYFSNTILQPPKTTPNSRWPQLFISGSLAFWLTTDQNKLRSRILAVYISFPIQKTRVCELRAPDRQTHDSHCLKLYKCQLSWSRLEFSLTPSPRCLSLYDELSRLSDSNEMVCDNEHHHRMSVLSLRTKIIRWITATRGMIA